ncbi:SDR family NAD(P)-dependent oxidoreductase [Mycolicibacterium vaccae]|uniref:SDR family NAD(P)-dependent oxidoreductase n=1 Tax=Mycolicibacterium vaccae TaxID=1810 RepID=UPI003CF4DA58
MTTPRRLVGRIALVTGGSNGQGAAHTRRLAQEGAIVYFSDIDTSAGAALEATLRAENLDVHFRKHDVSDFQAWQDILAEIDTEHGRLDILVNNAGIADIYTAEDATEESWQRIVDINQKSIFLSFKAAVPLLRKSKSASVINTSSIFGLVGADGYIAYVASKGAVTLMTKSTAITYGREGIRVNSIHPGYIATPMLEEELADLGDGAEERILATIPLGRFSSAEEISGAVAFLASDDASYITGAELLIDGGHLAGR